MRGSALDIGGSRARVYEFDDGVIICQTEIWLPDRGPGESVEDWGGRRVDAIAELVGGWTGCLPAGKLPTACAGRKDRQRESVVESTYGSPLLSLVPTVQERTGISLGPLLDDDVCAGWGHLASPRGGLKQNSPDTVLLTAGTGLAECLWVKERFLVKGTYPRLAELDLEAPLRAEAWRGQELPLAPLENLLLARGDLGRFQRVVLSGRFASAQGWPPVLADGVALVVCALEEAPALGALTLARQVE